MLQTTHQYSIQKSLSQLTLLLHFYKWTQKSGVDLMRMLARNKSWSFLQLLFLTVMKVSMVWR